MSDTLDIIINDARWASENPILALKRKPAPGALHVVTVGENIPARLWFFDGPEGAASLATARKNGVTIGLFAKLVRKDGETLLFGTTVFTELQDARGDYGYACSLDLLTDELKNAFNQGFDGSAFVDIRINGVRTHQFKLPIRPRTYAGTELDTHPAAEGLLEEMQAAAAEADADAAAANAAKVAAEGFKNEAQGFRNEAEGFKNESEAARDASQGFRNEAEGFKNDAEDAASAAAISEAACASAALVAGMPGGALTVFKNDSTTTGTTGYVTPGTNAWMDGESVIVVIRDGSNTGGARSPICSGNAWAILTTGLGNLSIWDQAAGTVYSGAAGQVPIGVPVIIGVRIATATNTLTLILNGTVVASVVLASGSPATDYCLLGSLGLGTFNAYGSFGGTIYRARSGNFTLTPAEALGASRGEAVGRLIYKAASYATPGNFRVIAGPGGTVTGASTTSVTFSAPLGVGNYLGLANDGSGYAPAVKAGQIVRIRATVTNTGTAMADAPKATLNYGGVEGVHYATSVAGNDYTFDLVAASDHAAGGLPALVLYTQSGGTTVVTNYSVTNLGTLTSYSPENCLLSATWCDESENCYDLSPFGGVIALKPKSSYTRRIAVTCSGSGAIGANTSASVGTLTGVTAADTAALAAIKAGDSVTAQFGGSMPAHIVALIANAPSAGAPVVRAHADATGDTVASSTALTLTHTQS